MKITRNMEFARTALFACIAVGLSACGHSAPSESDAKAAVEARLGDCKYFRVTDFEKINGSQLDDNDYQVQIKYTVSLASTGDLKDRLKEDKKLFDEYQPLKADYQARLSALQKEHDDVMAARDGKDPTFDAVAEDNRFDQQKANDPELVSDMAKVKEIAAKIGPVSASGLFQKAIAQECPNMRVPNGFMLTYFNPGITIDQFIDGMDAQFKETISMAKTDNGWQEAR